MATLAELPELIGFFSYSREDDDDSSGALSALRDRIQRELRGQLGRARTDFRLWQDKAAIPHGALWEEEIKSAVAQSVFFIPIVTPSTIRSPHCKFEFDLFMRREAELGRRDLIFPILYIGIPALDDEKQWRQNELLNIIGTRQYIDWRAMRFLSVNSPDVGVKVEEFCRNIFAALQQPWVSAEERARLSEDERAARRAQEERQRADAARRAQEDERRAREAADAQQRAADECRARESEATRRAAEEEARRKQAEADARARAEAKRAVATSEITPEADIPSLDPGAIAARAIGAAIEQAPIGRWWLAAAAILGSVMLCIGFELTAAAYSAAAISSSFGISPQSLTIYAAVAVGQVIGALAFGWIADRYGRARAIVGAVIVFGTASLLCMLASPAFIFTAFRFIQGLGMGGAAPVAATYLFEFLGRRHRGRLLLLYLLCGPTGSILASLILPGTVGLFGWQTLFIFGALSLLVVPVIWLALPESPLWLATRGRHEEAKAALERVSRRGSDRPAVDLELAASPPAEDTARRPGLGRRVLLIMSVWLGATIANSASSTLAPFFYRFTFHFAPSEIGAYTMTTLLLGILGTLVCAFTIVDRAGRRWWLVIGFLAAAVGFVVAATMPSNVSFISVIGISAPYFFTATIGRMLYLYVPELFLTRRRAFAVGAASAWTLLVSLLLPSGPTLMGVGFSPVYVMFSVVAMLAALIAMLLPVATKGRSLSELAG